MDEKCLECIFYNDCSRCPVEPEYCLLIDQLVGDIMYLELELVKARAQLVPLLDEPCKTSLKHDLLSSMAGRYHENELYSKFTKRLYHGIDPMESEEQVKQKLDIYYAVNQN